MYDIVRNEIKYAPMHCKHAAPLLSAGYHSHVVVLPAELTNIYSYMSKHML